jgi:hypothetical protein
MVARLAGVETGRARVPRPLKFTREVNESASVIRESRTCLSADTCIRGESVDFSKIA